MAMSSLPRGVIALGLVSLCMDLSSEMIHGLLPVYLVSVLGVGTLSVGLIEGVAEATVAITKVFSGVISDWIGRRKPLVLLGYGLAALSKPLFPLATGVAEVLTARFLDRVGKGIRGAPRDALIADITPREIRGAAYGLRQAMDTVGAFAGPLLAITVMSASHNSFRLVFWIATVPAFLCVLLIVVGVEEPAAMQQGRQGRFPIKAVKLRQLSARFWWLVVFAAALTLARFSEAFLLLRGQGLGMPVTWVPMVLIVMNVVYALSAYPFGRHADNGDRQKQMVCGIAFLIGADLILAAAGTVWAVFLGAAVWGLHMGATQGLFASMVADAAPVDLRGTAFGVFNLINGMSLLAASVIAGGLWAVAGPSATFYAGAAFSSVAVAGLFVTVRIKQR